MPELWHLVGSCATLASGVTGVRFGQTKLLRKTVELDCPVRLGKNADAPGHCTNAHRVNKQRIIAALNPPDTLCDMFEYPGVCVLNFRSARVVCIKRRSLIKLSCTQLAA